ncbi:MAG: hypothetical protein ACKOOI_14200 [Pirellula sp.]
MSGASLPSTVTNTNPYGLAQVPVGQAGTMSQAPSNNNPYGSTLPPGGSGIRSAVYGPVPQPNNNSQNNIPNLPPAYGGSANGIPVSGVPAYGNPGLAPQGIPQGIPQGLPQGLSQGVPQGIPQMIPQGMPQGVPSLPNLPNSPGLPPSSIPSAQLLPSSSAPGMPSLPPASSSGAYRPGSVGRSTSYDFSGQNQVR